MKGKSSAATERILNRYPAAIYNLAEPVGSEDRLPVRPFFLIPRHLESIADHAGNIAEEVFYLKCSVLISALKHFIKRPKTIWEKKETRFNTLKWSRSEQY